MPMSIEEMYAAAKAFDASQTPAERVAFARLVRSAWLDSGGTDQTWRANFPKVAAELDAAEKS